jgi:hydroxyacylglutathione hydrolase
MSFPPPIEDNAADILFKAQRGLKLDDEGLSARSGVGLSAIQALRDSNDSDDATFSALSDALGLNFRALLAIARSRYIPSPILAIEGLRGFNTPFDDMTVNSYILWDPETLEAAIFDTGSDGQGMLDFARSHGLSVTSIFLTHTHTDHIFDLDRLVEKTGAHAWVGDREPLSGAESFSAGKGFKIGWLTVETRLTCGHSPGGITYVISGLSQPVAIVGDAVFAGSMGGGMVSYDEALRTNRAEILTLPDNTILCPGHGPLTTVGEQKSSNPFLAL